MIKIHPVRKFMSTSPITVGPGAKRTEALALMRAKKIHHMPVCDSGRVVGMVTESDLAEPEPGGEGKMVKDLMRARPYTVSPESPVDEVVKEMAGHKHGSAAVVVDNGRVVGMFTATDGLRAFADFLRTAR
ncbi:MAG: CBS domain-containing protein [Archangium sp.]|nr:CBS domain-containing protein [Archangium sp.]